MGEPPVLEQYGEAAVRIRFSEPLEAACRRARKLAERIRDHSLPEVVDVANGARTVLVELDGPPSGALLALLASESQPSEGDDDGALIEVPVRYDGEDLGIVAGTLGATAEDVADWHAGGAYTVAFLGFSPGFPYLLGTPAPLASMPRRSTPRARVPAGSVAIAGGWTGIYPSATPGGWHLLGSTDVELFDPAADPPSRLLPGDRVRFVPR